jgi:uncharacterized protein
MQNQIPSNPPAPLTEPRPSGSGTAQVKSKMIRSTILFLLPLTLWAADSPLAQAVKDGDRPTALSLLAAHTAVNQPEQDGTTALHWAAHFADTDMVDRLLKAGADPKARNQFGATPISEAALSNSAPIIDKLLQAGADPNAPASDGMTPLMIVARSTNVQAAKLLLDHGANVNAKESQKDQTALMWAAAQKQGAMVKLLVSYKAEVNARTRIDENIAQVSAEPRAGYRSYGGLSALLYASREGCIACVQALKEGGANLNQADPEGVTPLIIAIWNAHFDTASYLIKAGANVNKWDWWGRSPLYLAVDYNTLPHGGRPDGPSLDETSPLQVIDQLLNASANPNLQLKLLPPFRSVGSDRGVDNLLSIGTTPLLRAAKAQDAPAIALLLKHGALPNLPNAQGVTPTMAAAGLGSVDADTRGWYTTDDIQQRSIASLDLLLKAGGEINATGGRTEQTPLHAASFWGWNEVVKYLVAHGADVKAKDNKGMNAIDAALGRAGGNSRGGQRVDVHQDTADLLIKLGVPPPVVAAK